jgi:hypothetical protein
VVPGLTAVVPVVRVVLKVDRYHRLQDPRLVGVAGVASRLAATAQQVPMAQ